MVCVNVNKMPFSLWQYICFLPTYNITSRIILTNNVQAPSGTPTIFIRTTDFLRPFPNNLSKVIIFIGSRIIIGLSLVVPSFNSTWPILETSGQVLTILTMRMCQYTWAIVVVGIILGVVVGINVPCQISSLMLCSVLVVSIQDVTGKGSINISWVGNGSINVRWWWWWGWWGWGRW